jgi:hypothetical protein
VRSHQIEAKVHHLIDRVAAGCKAEDSSVELKAEWPPADRAARRIAAHANASRGDPILWVIGLDEDRGVIPFSPLDVAEWWGRVSSKFDGLAPGLVDLVVPSPNGPVVALYFTTERLPFVVKNGTDVTPTEGKATLEVPWRDGTRTRSATRAEVLRMLVPQVVVPKVEVISAMLTFHERVHRRLSKPGFEWEFTARLYVEPADDRTVTFPQHKTQVVWQALPALNTEELPEIAFRLPTSEARPAQRPLPHDVVNALPEAAVVNGPGVVILCARRFTSFESIPGGDTALVRVRLEPSRCEVPLMLEVPMRRMDQQAFKAFWGYGPALSPWLSLSDSVG